MLDDTDIDAISMATPDHWHALQTINERNPSRIIDSPYRRLPCPRSARPFRITGLLRNLAAGWASFLISNPQNKSNTVTIRFILPNSLTWLVDLRCLERPALAGRVSTRTFTIDPGESLRLFTSGTDALATGWAKIESILPLNVSEVFDVLGPSAAPVVSSEAGVLPAPLSTHFSFFVTEASDEPAYGTDVGTGFALVNPSGADAQVTATLYSRFGTLLAQRPFTVFQNHQTAVFVSQLFREVDFTVAGRSHGMVRFSSSVNIAMVALRQTRGNSSTISTIAVNPDSQLGMNIIYDREPNDTRATAQPIGALPTMIIGTINSPTDGRDVDTFSVTLQAGSVLYVVLLADMIGSPLEDVIQIQDAGGNAQLVVDTLLTGLRDHFVRFQVPASGTYFISHTGQGNTYGRGSYYRILLMAR